jgi:riboflavin synthase alpha subunit
LKPGSPVNLEIDTVARYVERMLQFDSPRPSHQKADA